MEVLQSIGKRSEEVDGMGVDLGYEDTGKIEEHNDNFGVI